MPATERRAAKKATKKRAAKKRAPRAELAPRAPTRSPAPDPRETETAEQAITAIAQDAVIILRRELAFYAELSQRHPGTIAMSDCIALLRLLADLAPAAMKGQDGHAVDYEALAPDERVQLAALLSKVAAA